MPERAAPVLLRFAHLVAEADADELLPALAEAAGPSADAAVALRVVEDGTVRVVASQGDAGELAGFSADADTIGSELADQIRAALGGRFRNARAYPMVNSGSLFGALVLLYRSADPPDPNREALASALVDLTATAMSKAAQLAELRRAHAELRASQEALLRTEKLRALGQMAAGITHDFKNILNPLWLHLQFLEKGAGKDDPATIVSTAQEMKQVLRRGLETVERLRLFSRQAPESKVEMCDVNKMVHEAVDIARPRMASGVNPQAGAPASGRLSAISEELGEPPAIFARSGEVVAAIVNLVVNAIDAMPNGGTITLRTRSERGGAVIDVTDDGPGMPPDVEAHVFEPFFTTKGDAGTGLGLSMVYACVQRHGGTIVLSTRVGQGTTFSMWFPGAM